MSYTRFVLLVFLMGLATFCSSTGFTTELDDSLPTQIEDFRVSHNLPALAVSVISGEETQYITSGTISISSDIPVDPSSRFAIASQTKAITGMMIAKLVDRDLISWDTTVSECFDGFGADIIDDYRDLRLEELISHQGGIISATEYDAEKWGWQEITALADNGRDARIKLAKDILTTTAPHPVRGNYLYSNAGYAIATAMVEKMSNKDWWELIEDEVLTPLGVDAYQGWPSIADTSHPWPHEYSETGFKAYKPTTLPVPPALACGGGINMTLTDYTTFIRHAMDSFNGTGSYSKQTLGMLDSHGYFIGWGKSNLDDKACFDHQGLLTTGAQAIAVVVPADELAIIAVTNAVNDISRVALQRFAFALVDQQLIK